MFAIVENDQRAPVLQVPHHGQSTSAGFPRTPRPVATRVHKRGVIGRGQIHEMNTVRECVMARMGDRDGEAALSHAARADKGDEAGEVERSGHTVDIALPAYEKGGRRQIARRPLIVAVGGEVRCLHAFSLDPSHELVSMPDNRRNVGCRRKRSSRARRRLLMWTFRLRSSTNTFGQANSISAFLLTSSPARITSSCRISNALPPSFTGRLSRRSRFRLGISLNGPNTKATSTAGVTRSLAFFPSSACTTTRCPHALSWGARITSIQPEPRKPACRAPSRSQRRGQRQ